MARRNQVPRVLHHPPDHHSCRRRGCIRAAAVDVFVLPPWMYSCCRRGCLRAAAVDVFVLPPWMYSCCRRECKIRCQQGVMRHLLREIRSKNSFKNTSSDTYALTKMFRGICPQGFDRSNVLLQIGSEIQINIKLWFAKHGVEHVLSTKCFETHTLKQKKAQDQLF